MIAATVLAAVSASLHATTQNSGMKSLLALLVIAVAVGPSPAFAQTAPGANGEKPMTIEQRFERLDSNADGFIAWEEARPGREAEFRIADSNGDDALSEVEFGQRALPLAAFDSSRDGKITLEEFLAKHHGMFAAADKDARLQ